MEIPISPTFKPTLPGRQNIRYLVLSGDVRAAEALEHAGPGARNGREYWGMIQNFTIFIGK